MQGRRLLVWIIAMTLCSGCEVGRTMFQMDSNSGQPFFGVDLLRARSASRAPRRPTDPAAVVTQVRSGRETKAAPVAMAVESRTTEPSLLERLKLKRGPERISLSLAASEEDEPEGPVEEFR